jgi:hypothetical protein
MSEEKPKWWEDRVDEMFVGLIVGVISVVAIAVLKADSVPIVSAAISVCGMYMVGKPRTNGNGD